MIDRTNDQLLADIEKLAQLKERGILTEKEFTTEKRQLLRRMNADVPEPTENEADVPEPIQPAVTEPVKTEPVTQTAKKEDPRTAKPTEWYKKPLGSLFALLFLPSFFIYCMFTYKDSQDEWYQHGLGAVAAVIFVPFFIVWHIWARKAHWHVAGRIAATVVLLTTYAGFASAASGPAPQTQAKAPVKTSQTATPAKPETKEVKEVKSVAFTTQDENDANSVNGTTTTKQEGQNGEQTFVYKVTYLNGKETGRNVESESITKQPVTKIVSHGTYVAPAKATPAPVSSAPQSSGSVYYANCTAARAAGAAPVYRGQPGYRAALDRDDDGVGCE